jgi:predicted lipoprotein with Yx(FWY)xxD motif
MKRKYLTSVVLTAGIAGLLVTAFAVGSGMAKARSSVRTVVSVRHTPLGQTLVGANGRTLYLFEGDKTKVSTLSSAGREIWPPLTAIGTVKAAGGASAGKLGTSTGPSGVRQVTYNGHPLYYYVGDTAPGSTKGQHLSQFGAVWFAVAPSGAAIRTAPSSSGSHSASPVTSSGSGSGW